MVWASHCSYCTSVQPARRTSSPYPCSFITAHSPSACLTLHVVAGDQRHSGDERLSLVLHLGGQRLRQRRVGVRGRAPHPHQVHGAPVHLDCQSRAGRGTLREVTLGQCGKPLALHDCHRLVVTGRGNIHDGLEQLCLRPERVVDRLHRDTGFLGDVPHTRRRPAALHEQPVRHGEHSRACPLRLAAPQLTDVAPRRGLRPLRCGVCCARLHDGEHGIEHWIKQGFTEKC